MTTFATAHRSSSSNCLTPVKINKLKNYDSISVTYEGPKMPDDISPRSALPVHHTHTNSNQKLKLLPLAILVFYNVSGGPFGIEPSLRSGGPFYTILGFLILPFIWSIPEALVTAELGSAFKSSSGGVIWVQTAFGETAGAFCGYLGYVAGATDNAIYPSLFLSYLAGSLDADMNQYERFLYVSVISLILAWLNFRGLEIVGTGSVIVCIIAMSPFVIMTLLGLSKVDSSKWFIKPEEGINPTDIIDDDFETSSGPLPLLFYGILLRPFLNNMFWNLNSFDSAASFACEVVDVHRTYPRGIFVAVLLCFVFYIIPLLVAIGATDYAQHEWVDGQLGKAAKDIGGPWLGGWTVLAAGISNLALFEAELSADSYQLMGMAEQGYLPSILKTRSKYGTPTYGIIIGTLIIICFSVADFSQLLELLNVNYALALVLEYTAFVKLRYSNPNMERPYRIPIPNWAAVLLVIPPILAIVVLFLVANWITYYFVIGTCIVCVGFHKMQEVARVKGWWEYDTVIFNGAQLVSTVEPTQPAGAFQSEYGDTDEEMTDSNCSSTEEDISLVVVEGESRMGTFA
jgi:amino acid transporter